MSEWQEQEQERYDRESEKALTRRPNCSWCGEPIEDDYAYDLGDGILVCEDCIQNASVYVQDLD